MSTKITGPIWDLCLEGRAKLVLIKYGDQADDFGENAYPSVLTVARECGISRATAQRIIADLIADGALVLQENAAGGRGNLRKYRVDLLAAGKVYGWLESNIERRSKSCPLKPYSKAGGDKGPQSEALSGDAKGPQSEALSGDKGPQSGDKGPQTEQERASRDEAKPLNQQDASQRPVREPSEEPSGARVREAPCDAAAPDGAAPPGAEHDQAQAPPANAHWRTRQKALARLLGDATYKSWVERLIVISDDGTTITLGAPNDFWRDYVNGKRNAPALTDAMATVLDRQVRVVTHNFSVLSAKRRSDKVKADREAMREQ